MTRAALIIAVISALCLGIALGFMGGVMISRHLLFGGPRGPIGFWLERRMHHGLPPGGPEHGVMRSPGRIASRLKNVLNLTPEQETAIRGELERTRPEFALVRDSLHSRIERLLTPEQRQHWLNVIREQHRDEPFEFEGHPDPEHPGRPGGSR